MPQIIVTKPFDFAHYGYQIEHFDPAPEPRKTTDECAEIACREGWAHLPNAMGKAAHAAAPENADAARKPRARKADPHPDAVAYAKALPNQEN